MGNALATYQGRDGSEPPPETVTLLDLPLLVMEKISVYLSAEDVWQLGATCRQLRELCTDDKLWRDRIMREARTLIVDELSDEQAVFQHQRHQITMTVSNPRLDQPRLHWSSVRPRKRREPPSRGALLDSWALITDLVTGRNAASAAPAGVTPRILMYGSGLENKSVLRRMMMDKAEGLHVHSLVPSANRGVGAGVRFRFSDDATFDLITLYSNTSEVRRRRTLGGAASQTRLYASVNEGGRLKMEPFVTDLLQHADGVVHVVEAAEEKGDYGFESLEREAMQEAMTESGRQLPLLTLLLAAEPPHSRSSTLGWRAQQRLAPPPAGPHAVLTTSVCSLTDLSHGFSWLTAVCRLEKRQHEAAPDRPEQAEFAFGATASAAAATASGGT
ncbi:uncharacterized protein LOC122387245 [Amphibalanus amphitrite]|uniref:uncharacterized protein LOC122387245 n=1 Tax=Amphibalanus amphitrite TaxID=1232801 RepID=UPI001C906DD9|nr:uncharacterized protein LOC122387245 [Amphibalanus amphitrite]XP_043233234.1 uncharacterized protein LOC122387245 [Amphibalanus amphitrite]